MRKTFDGKGFFQKWPKNEAYAQYFQGTSYLNMLSTIGVTIGNVVFESGCRNNWHIHHEGGQILLVTDGHSWYQPHYSCLRAEMYNCYPDGQVGDIVNG